MLIAGVYVRSLTRTITCTTLGIGTFFGRLPCIVRCILMLRPAGNSTGPAKPASVAGVPQRWKTSSL